MYDDLGLSNIRLAPVRRGIGFSHIWHCLLLDKSSALACQTLGQHKQRRQTPSTGVCLLCLCWFLPYVEWASEWPFTSPTI